MSSECTSSTLEQEQKYVKMHLPTWGFTGTVGIGPVQNSLSFLLVSAAAAGLGLQYCAVATVLNILWRDPNQLCDLPLENLVN